MSERLSILRQQGTCTYIELGDDDRAQAIVSWYQNDTRYMLQAAIADGGRAWAAQYIAMLERRGLVCTSDRPAVEVTQ
jgi:hypothetical protein